MSEDEEAWLVPPDPELASDARRPAHVHQVPTPFPIEFVGLGWVSRQSSAGAVVRCSCGQAFESDGEWWRAISDRKARRIVRRVERRNR